MKKSVLELHNAGGNVYQAFIKNNHGRKLYLRLSAYNENCEILDCFYIDRAKRCEPKLLETRSFKLDELLTVIAKELDKKFSEYQFLNTPVLTTEDFIEKALHQEKYNILIMLKEENTLKTIFKNRFHRAIYLEIEVYDEKALIKNCKYCDERGADTSITPYSITTIYFDYNFTNLLNIVNNELEGGFTDILITENHTIKLDRAICGSI